MQPIKDNNQLMALYVVLFVFLGGFFWVSLLVGVIIDQYTRMLLKAKQAGDGVLVSSQQSEWMQVRPASVLACSTPRPVPHGVGSFVLA